MDTIDILKKGMLISAVAFLVACGGGSSSSSGGPTYNGKTEPAKITADNADSLLSASIDGASAASQSASVSSESSAEQTKARLPGIAARLKKLSQSASKKLDSQGSVTAIITPVNETNPGNCGGEEIVSGSYNDETFEISMNIQYNSYCDTEETDGSTMTGGISVTGTFDIDAGYFEFNMSFRSLTSVDETDSLTLNGTIAMSGTDTTFNVSMTFDFSDNNANKVYRVENYKIAIEEFGIYPSGHYTASISGKVYHPDFGSYTIATLQPVYVNFADDYPYAGVIKISGDNSSVTATFLSGGKYKLEIDEDGDDIADVIKSCDSKTDTCEII